MEGEVRGQGSKKRLKERVKRIIGNRTGGNQENGEPEKDARLKRAFFDLLSALSTANLYAEPDAALKEYLAGTENIGDGSVLGRQIILAQLWQDLNGDDGRVFVMSYDGGRSGQYVSCGVGDIEGDLGREMGSSGRGDQLVVLFVNKNKRLKGNGIAGKDLLDSTREMVAAQLMIAVAERAEEVGEPREFMTRRDFETYVRPHLD